MIAESWNARILCVGSAISSTMCQLTSSAERRDPDQERVDMAIENLRNALTLMREADREALERFIEDFRSASLTAAEFAASMEAVQNALSADPHQLAEHWRALRRSHAAIARGRAIPPGRPPKAGTCPHVTPVAPARLRPYRRVPK